MKLFPFILVLTLLAGSAIGQTADTLKPQTDRDTAAFIYKRKPGYSEFPGGNAAMEKYMMENIIRNIRQENLGDTIPEKMIAKFMVSSAGKIHKVQLVKSSGSGYIDQLFLNALHKMPDWVGGCVEFEFTLPFFIQIRTE